MNIIVVFPKLESAKNVRNVLVKSGYTVDAVCSNGAQALQAANDLDSGIIICTCRLPDMMYRELYEYLTPRYEMLLIGPADQIADSEAPDIYGLAVPLKVHELLEAMEMLTFSFQRRKKKQKKMPKVRSDEENRVILEAKELLMRKKHMTEAEAHWYLQKSSMDSGNSLTEAAQMICQLLQEH